jgi:hypothetical protein
MSIFLFITLYAVLWFVTTVSIVSFLSHDNTKASTFDKDEDIRFIEESVWVGAVWFITIPVIVFYISVVSLSRYLAKSVFNQSISFDSGLR